MNNLTASFFLTFSLSTCCTASADEFTSGLEPERHFISGRALTGPKSSDGIEVLFATDSTKLSPAATAALKPFINRVKFDATTLITLTGHSDARGSKNHNMVLSLNRAKIVRDYLIDHGVRPDNVRIVGRGESRAAINIREPEKLVEDRRVVIRSSNIRHLPMREKVTKPLAYAQVGPSK